jgi:hypothetical protein
MEQQVYPWRASLDIRQVLAEVRPTFLMLNSIDPAGGCAPDEIKRAETRIGVPLPNDLREFYLAFRPTKLFRNDVRQGFGFYPVSSDELRWRSMEGAEPEEDWISARAVAIGQSEFGNPFWLVENHRSIPDGGIVLLNHDGAIPGRLAFVYYARSLREFLLKLAHFQGLYASKDQDLFYREHMEMNPTDKLSVRWRETSG